MNYIATVFLASLMLFSISTCAAAEKPVTFKGSIQPDAVKAGHFTVTVRLDIKDGWHTYAEVGEGAEQRTSLEWELPEGVKAAGDWKRPRGIDSPETQARLYEWRASFSRSVIIEPSAYGKSIDVIVSYQACTDTSCNPPQSKTVSIAIPAGAPTGPSIFEGPVRIDVDGEPLNAVVKTRFPSPGVFDVDGDGAAELVIGGLMGSVGVYENQNTSGKGDPVWGSRENLKNAQGKRIRTSNW